MCRLYGFLASGHTKVECSLVMAQNALLTQSRADLRGVSHADGWGISYYENGQPMVEKRASAAFRSPHFSVTAERVYARVVVAHVRRATISEPSAPNTHPFVHGVWSFAHNGTLRPFDRIAPVLETETPADLLRLRCGSTDSELSFYWLLGRLRSAGIELACRSTGLDQLVPVVRDAAKELTALCQREQQERAAEFNFLLTDGAVLVAHRWNHPLLWVQRDGIHDCEICGIPHVLSDEQENYHAAVVASEPLSHESWMEVPNGSLLAISVEGRARLHPGSTIEQL